MSEFEKWWKKEINVKVFSLIKNNYPDGTFTYADHTTNLGWITWQAATAESDKRIAELKAKVSELDGMLGSRNLHKEHEYLQRMSERQAHINVLREALEEISSYQVDEVVDAVCDEAISSTPAQSLQEHDNEMIERVVTLLKDWTWGDGIIDMRADDLIEDVRKLKGK